jgi:hypothetical protein
MEMPIFELLISENEASGLQVDYVALVDKPAIERNFMAFASQVEAIKFSLNEDRRIISGPAMLADMPIFRKADGTRPDHYVIFSQETIYKIAQKFFEKGYQNNFNAMHNSNQRFEDVSIFESFIVDSARGIQPMLGFEDAKNGSWFISAKVNDMMAWEKVKSGEFKGFSVEGIFSYKDPEESKEEKMLSEILEILNK